MDKIDEAIKTLKEAKEKAHPDLLGSCPMNYPFYIEIAKPRASLSKHDDTRKTYWHIDDGSYLAHLVHLTPLLIEELERLRKNVNC